MALNQSLYTTLVRNLTMGCKGRQNVKMNFQWIAKENRAEAWGKSSRVSSQKTAQREEARFGKRVSRNSTRRPIEPGPLCLDASRVANKARWIEEVDKLQQRVLTALSTGTSRKTQRTQTLIVAPLLLEMKDLLTGRRRIIIENGVGSLEMTTKCGHPRRLPRLELPKFVALAQCWTGHPKPRS